MQNMDFHNRSGIKNFHPQFDPQDPEYFSRMPDFHIQEANRNRKKASRMMSVIIALCIVSFTAGLVLGIKFAGGSQREIVDQTTKQTVSAIGKKVATFINEDAVAKPRGEKPDGKNLFPRDEYPYVVRIGGEFREVQSREIANYLSTRGHTVILSRADGESTFRVYAGPYKTSREAEIVLKKINDYPNRTWFNTVYVVKR